MPLFPTSIFNGAEMSTLRQDMGSHYKITSSTDKIKQCCTKQSAAASWANTYVPIKMSNL